MNKKESLKRLKTYAVWEDMIARCNDPEHPEYKNEGAKGITVCEKWMEPNGKGFKNFVDDMGYIPDNLMRG